MASLQHMLETPGVELCCVQHQAYKCQADSSVDCACVPADAYVLKCHEIGETPCSKVAAQLKCPSANMAHCKLGR